MKRMAFPLALCVLLLAACGSSSKQADEATTTSLAPSTTSTTESYAVPATIDAAYLNRVLAAINHVRGDIRRDEVQTQTLPPVDQAKLGDIYADLALSSNITVWQNAAATVNPEFKPVPGDENEKVQSILKVDNGCVVFTTMDDGNALYNQPSPPTGPWVMSMWTFDGSHGSNPTPWKVELDVLQGDKGSDYRC